jgi:hypothetical protein
VIVIGRRHRVPRAGPRSGRPPAGRGTATPPRAGAGVRALLRAEAARHVPRSAYILARIRQIDGDLALLAPHDR